MQKHHDIPILQLSTLFVFVFEYFTLFKYIRIVSVFTNSIQYSYLFQISKRILFVIRIRSKITTRPNTGCKLKQLVIYIHIAKYKAIRFLWQESFFTITLGKGHYNDSSSSCPKIANEMQGKHLTIFDYLTVQEAAKKAKFRC